MAVEGSYVLRGDTIVVRDTGGPLACQPDAAGTYLWALRAGKLTLKVVDEACVERGDGLAREWAAVAGAPPAGDSGPPRDMSAALVATRPPSLRRHGTR